MSERRRLIALVDCSAFYCSCERLFRPDLHQKPVVVLSNNDGCVIARSQEAKDLGIKMGAPYFQIERELKRQKVNVFSSNYALYHDLSCRVHTVLERFSPDVERYSIDEAFLEIHVDPSRPEEERDRVEQLARDIRQAVFRATRIPVRVSFAETKTLAKAASEHARALLKRGEEPCVCFWGHPNRERFLAELPVDDVWGIGRQWAKKLHQMGFHNALSLIGLNDKWIRRNFNVVMLRHIMELRGTSCIPLEQVAPIRKSLVRSRMFGSAQTELGPLRKAVATHAATAARKLRAEGLAAGFLEVFVSTGRHGFPIRKGRAVSALIVATNDTISLSKTADKLLREAYRHRSLAGDVYRYKKAGVILSDLVPEQEVQSDLFGSGVPEHPGLMQALDRLNERFGKRAVVLATQGTPDSLRSIDAATSRNGWGMKRERMSPRYTTRWDELPRVVLG